MKEIILFLLLILFIPFFVSAQEMVDINTASSEELQEITGIGSVYAQRIIDARPFSSIDDLLRVNGIGEKTLQKIKDQGLAFVEEKLIKEEPETEVEEPEPKPIEEKQEVDKSVEDRPLRIYPKNIVFIKIMPSPEGSDAENEWIEIYNSNDFKVDLSGWKIKDTTGRTNIYILKSEIPSRGKLKLKRPETKITLNNTGDGLELSGPDGKIADSVEFSQAPRGQAYIKTSLGWQWEKKITNNDPASLGAENAESKEKETTSLNKKEANVIDLSQKENSINYVALIAVITALISAGAVIALKNLLSGRNR